MARLMFAMISALFLPGTAAAIVCVASGHTSPTTCSKYTAAYGNTADDSQHATGTWMVWGCTGGTVTKFAGMSYCSSASGTYPQQGNPSSGRGQYCWCALTSPALSGWVFLIDNNGVAFCSKHCAYNCASMAGQNSDFRSGLFAALGA